MVRVKVCVRHTHLFRGVPIYVDLPIEEGTKLDTHQIPAVFLDPLQSVFGDDTPDEARHVDRRAEFEVELDSVFCLVDELDEVPAEADGHLREVVAWHEREGGVQGLDVPPPGGEVEEVGVPIRDEPVERWFGELGLE